MNRVASVKHNCNAVAHDVDDADHLLDLPDRLGRRSRRRLSVLSGRLRTGEQIDEIRRQLRAVRRRQSGPICIREIAGDDVPMTVWAGQDQIWSGVARNVLGIKLRIRC